MRLRCFRSAFSVGIAAVALAVAVSVAGAREAGFRFPPSLEGFRLGEKRDFEQQAPGLGYSVPYYSSQWTVTAYIYDLQRADIPDGPDSDAVAGQLAEAASDIRRVVSQGLYAGLVEQESFQIPEGSPALLKCKAFVITNNDQSKFDSLLCLTARHGKFVKFRMSSKGKASRQDVIRLVTAWLQQQ